MNDAHSVNEAHVIEPLKRRRVSKAPEVRREELLEVAARLFAEKGVAETSVADVTEFAKVARGTFYLYFSSKDEIVAELWQRYVAGFMSTTDALMTCVSGEERGRVVLELLARLTEHALDHAHLHRAIYGSADAAAIALCKKSDEVILERLTEAIGAHHAALGQSRSDAGRAANFLFYGLDGSLHRAIMKSEPIDRAKFMLSVRDLAKRVLGINPSISN